LFAIPEVKERFRESVRMGQRREGVAEAHALGTKAAWSDPVKRAAFIAGMQKPDAKARRAAATARRYEDPNYRLKQSLQQKNDPKRAEQLRKALARRWQLYRERKNTA
jgi:hypothetical protein